MSDAVVLEALQVILRRMQGYQTILSKLVDRLTGGWFEVGSDMLHDMRATTAELNRVVERLEVREEKRT